MGVPTHTSFLWIEDSRENQLIEDLLEVNMAIRGN